MIIFMKCAREGLAHRYGVRNNRQHRSDVQFLPKQSKVLLP
jgi:hypothetical protein